MEELTGQPATWMSPASLTLSQLQGFMTAGDLIVMDTPGSGTLPYNLVNNHAYMFEQPDHGQRHGHGATDQSLGLRPANRHPACLAGDRNR